MEKITLKPAAKELVYRNGEDKVHFDVLSYHGTSIQEKLLGSLFIVGQVKYDEDDLAYAVSLISSLAKREYYSDWSLSEQNAKLAFERTLKKLNEVLEDFFQNKNFKLNIGLVSISGDNIYISRLGKFKIALARNDEYIDVLNNIDLFSKDIEDAEQFSNIISGKLKAGDKIFAYFPARAITLREKQLNDIFVKESQDNFSHKIGQLAENTNNFSCCGVHIDMRQIKEIPIQPVAQYSVSVPQQNEPKTAIQKSLNIRSKDPSTASDNSRLQIASERPEPQLPVEIPAAEQPQIRPTELSMTKRANFLTLLANQFSKLRSFGRFPNKSSVRSFIIVAVIVIIPLLLFVFLKNGGSGEYKNVFTKANENLKLAQVQLGKNDFRSARSLLQAALSNAAGFHDKKIDGVRQEINRALDRIDKTSEKQPELFLSIPEDKNYRPVLLAAYGNAIGVTGADGIIFSATKGGITKLGQVKTTPKFIFGAPLAISVFNGSDTLAVYNQESKKIKTYSLNDALESLDAVLYENNLYVLSGNKIYKYNDAATGGVRRATWNNEDANNSTALAADGNIYVLANDGKMTKYFKGKKAGNLDLQVIPSAGSRIFTSKDSAFIYLTDKTNKRIYVFNKSSGTLKTTYKLEAIGTVQDISVTPDGTIWILSGDNKVWQIH